MIAFESAGQLAKRIRKKEISSRELTDLYIERIEKYDNEINSVIVRTFKKARAAADAACPAVLAPKQSRRSRLAEQQRPVQTQRRQPS